MRRSPFKDSRWAPPWKTANWGYGLIKLNNESTVEWRNPGAYRIPPAAVPAKLQKYPRQLPAAHLGLKTKDITVLVCHTLHSFRSWVLTATAPTGHHPYQNCLWFGTPQFYLTLTTHALSHKYSPPCGTPVCLLPHTTPETSYTLHIASKTLTPPSPVFGFTICRAHQ